MIVETRAVPPFQKNGYVVACDATREAVIIDPGDEVDALLEVARSQSVKIQHILLTHAHVDHSGLLPKLMLAGFTGAIYATQGTRDLCGVLLPDAGAVWTWSVGKSKRS